MQLEPAAVVVAAVVVVAVALAAHFAALAPV
jgi:hypothetical protein